MRSIRGFLFLAAALLAGPIRAQEPAIPFATAEADTDARATVVVYNENDDESKLLALFYAEKRGVPKEQVLGLKCSMQEEITRQEFDDTLADPLRRAFTANFWWNLREPDSANGPVEKCRIRYVALMRGIPLKIAPVTGYLGDKPFATSPIGVHNEASVDSELAVLGHRLRQISGAVNNPFFRSYTSFREARHPDLLMVCRLDGPTPTVVRRMIADSVATEAGGLRGFAYIDARGIAASDPGLYEGDQWLHNAAQDLRRIGMPVILDNGPALFPEGYPMRYAALYLGWYGDKVSGPFARPGFRFTPGAIAVHIHSFSGSSVRDVKSNWVAPLLESGAAATLGNVYEPYLSLTPHLDIFEERLRLGFNFAESAYASQRVLSWMTTFVGDPLYRPFPQTLVAPAAKGAAGEWEAYKKGAARWEQEPKAGVAMLQGEAQRLKSGIVWEGLALLQAGAGNHSAAIEELEEARKVYTNPEDILRVTIHEVIQLRGVRRDTEAVTLAKRQAAQFPTAPAVSVLQMLVPAAFPARLP